MAKKRVDPAASMRCSSLGIFTRSRSEVFLHRTRSGRARPDPARRPSRQPPRSAEVCGRVPAGVKDLRLRRVFSPASVPVEPSPEQKGKIRPKEDCSEVEELLPSKETSDGERNRDGFDEKMSMNQAMEDLCTKHIDTPVVNSNQSTDRVEVDELLIGSADLTEAIVPCPLPDCQNAIETENASLAQEMLDLPSEHKADPAKECSRLNGAGVEEDPRRLHIAADVSVDNTPSYRLNSTEAEKTSLDHEMEDLPNENCAPATRKQRGSPKTRLGLMPCSRLKLFQNPSSLSYKRMLPFLMDLAKDNPKGVQIFPSHSAAHSAQNLVKKRPALPSFHPLCEDVVARTLKCDVKEEQSNNIMLDRFVSEGSSEKLQVAEGVTKGIPNTLPCELMAHSNMEPIPDLLGKGELVLRDAKSEISKDPVLHPELLYSSSQSPPVSRPLSVEELSGTVHAPSYSPNKAEEACMIVPALQIYQEPSSATSPLAPISFKESSALAPREGILKRKTRGCIGICMCLDCVSFRIHADRAFEFSRKQMLEADEVILGLVKELSGLRNLVEESTSESDGACALLKANQELKGACRRASRAEEVASNRLRQMFSDMNFHCRIPGLRVTFEESVEKRSRN